MSENVGLKKDVNFANALFSDTSCVPCGVLPTQSPQPVCLATTSRCRKVSEIVALGKRCYSRAVAGGGDLSRRRTHWLSHLAEGLDMSCSQAEIRTSALPSARPTARSTTHYITRYHTHCSNH